MALNFEQFDTSGTVTADSLFIPVADLPGVDAAELDGSAEGTSKAVLSLLNAIFDTLSPANFEKLGFSVSKGNPSGVSGTVVGQTFGLVHQFMVDVETGIIDEIPVPASGALSGVGDFAITDIFPSASSLSAAASTGGAGLAVPSTETQAYGGPASPGADARQYLGALWHYLQNESPTRTGAVASAITATARGNAAGFSPPATWTQTTDPESGIASADLPKRAFFSLSFTITMQYLLDQDQQTFDVNHVTS